MGGVDSHCQTLLPAAGTLSRAFDNEFDILAVYGNVGRDSSVHPDGPGGG